MFTNTGPLDSRSTFSTRSISISGSGCSQLRRAGTRPRLAPTRLQISSTAPANEVSDVPFERSHRNAARSEDSTPSPGLGHVRDLGRRTVALT